jgi:AbrB family looped-hinge helix DNA binding protein
MSPPARLCPAAAARIVLDGCGAMAELRVCRGKDHPAMPGRYELRVDKRGQVVLPAPARRELGVDGGGTLTLEIGEHEARLSSTRMTARRIRNIIRRYVPEGVSLADERVADRRAQVAREDAED